MTSSRREQKGYSSFFVALIHLRNNQAEQTQQENLHLLNWLRYLWSQARHQRDVCSFPDWLHQEAFFLLISLISKTYQALWSFNMTVFMLLLHTTDGSLCKYYCRSFLLECKYNNRNLDTFNFFIIDNTYASENYCSFIYWIFIGGYNTKH